LVRVSDEERTDKHFLAPKWPFRLLILEPSGCGKTNLLFNLLFKHLHFDRLLLYSRHLDQPLYQKLQQCLDDDMIPPIEIDPEGISFHSNIDDIVSPDLLDKDEQNLYVFDDFITSKDQNNVTDVFIRGRHMNCSCIYLTQSYFPVPRNIRLNCNYFVIFNIHSKRELLELQKDHATNIEQTDFLKL